MSAGPRGNDPAASTTLPGYVPITLGRGSWISREDCAPGLGESDAPVLLEGRAAREPVPGRGRAPVARFRIGGFEAVGKRARHGGVLAPLLGGLYIGTRRAVWPLVAAARLRAQGVRTPAVLAVGWRRVIWPFYAHALVTESVPAATNLQGALAARPGIGRRRALLRAAGRTVRAMHLAGFLHADLNLANLVVEDTGDDPIVHVVDLDRGRFVGQAAGTCLANLRRMARSWEKWLGDAVPPGPRDAAAFLQAYCGADRAAKRSLMRGITRSWRGAGAR